MTSTDLLADAFGRISGTVTDVLQDLSGDDLVARVGPRANSIGWLVWHLTRVQDDHIAAAGDLEQVWLADGWQERFRLPYPPEAIGYGQSSTEVGDFQGVSVHLLQEYHHAVYQQTLRFLKGLGEGELDRVVDSSYRPPVTLAVRLVSIVSDDLQHVGQAAYVRGLLRRR
ncbi:MULTISPECIES: mycothiol transferase [Streptacidiphilus]|uniref:DUF664 domain-containing protein n=2 Tax=Streptacidiphilus TaxID=228398 RepID=A0ABV6UJC2_9ACTN|nr:DUF664 domain-containing protein [Streptacidiphilus jeojiense]